MSPLTWIIAGLVLSVILLLGALYAVLVAGAKMLQAVIDGFTHGS